MKNFYEATVIKDKLTIPVKVTVIPIGQLPCMVTVNKKVLFEDALTTTQVLHYELPVDSALKIEIQIYRQHPHAVSIKIEIDGNEIIPLYQQHAHPPTNYFDKSGIWQLNIPSFYPWYHTITGQGWIID
jgi:hypothetical protein